MPIRLTAILLTILLMTTFPPSSWASPSNPDGPAYNGLYGVSSTASGDTGTVSGFDQGKPAQPAEAPAQTAEEPAAPPPPEEHTGETHYKQTELANGELRNQRCHTVNPGLADSESATYDRSRHTVCHDIPPAEDQAPKPTPSWQPPWP